MREIILNLPEQFKIGFEAAKDIEILGNFNKIIICGMGGSALAGEILKIFFKEKEIKIPVLIHRNYNLPRDFDKKTLIFTISYSGNTEETISSLKEAIKKRQKTIAITSGGELLELCQKFKIPVVIVPKGLPPRMAVGILFSSLLSVLANSKIIKETSKEISQLEKKLKPENLEKNGKILAKRLKKKIILIYCPEELEGLARIWKLNLNETAKVPAFFNIFPEINHGEIQGFEEFGKFFHGLFFFDPKSNPRILKREKLTAQILKKKGVGIDFIFLRGKEILPKIFSNVILGNWVSYYLALFQKKEPLKTEVIEELKRKMKSKQN